MKEKGSNEKIVVIGRQSVSRQGKGKMLPSRYFDYIPMAVYSHFVMCQFLNEQKLLQV